MIGVWAWSWHAGLVAAGAILVRAATVMSLHRKAEIAKAEREEKARVAAEERERQRAAKAQAAAQVPAAPPGASIVSSARSAACARPGRTSPAVQALLVVAWSACLASLWCCKDDGPRATTGPGQRPPALEEVREPLARIPVRQEVIKAAVPENKVVTDQADATKADAAEAASAVSASIDQQRAQLEEQEKTIADLRAKLADAESDASKAHRARMYWVKGICALGMGAGVFLCFFTGPKFIFISLGCLVVNVSVTADLFIERWAEPIAAGSIVLVLGIGAWALVTHRIAAKQLVGTSSALIKQAGGLTQETKAVLNDIQRSSFTRRLVERFKPKAA